MRLRYVPTGSDVGARDTTFEMIGMLSVFAAASGSFADATTQETHMACEHGWLNK